MKRRGWKRAWKSVNLPSSGWGGGKASFTWGICVVCLNLSFPKAEPKTRIWAQVTYFRVDSRKLCEWDRKEGKMLMSKLPLWVSGAPSYWGPWEGLWNTPKNVSLRGIRLGHLFTNARPSLVKGHSRAVKILALATFPSGRGAEEALRDTITRIPWRTW